MKENFAIRRGVLVTDGWGGRSYQLVTVEGETPMRYRVRAVGEELRLPMRGRGIRKVLRSGTALVPKYAVRFDADPPQGAAVIERDADGLPIRFYPETRPRS